MKNKNRKFFQYAFLNKNRKGSHVGVVLSFVIFVTFLIFLYTILEPVLKVEKDKQALLDSLEIGLMEKFSADLSTVTISLKNSIKPCIEINHIDESLKNLEVLVKDDEDEPVDSESTSTSLKISSKKNKYFKIYYSEVSFDSSSIIDTCVVLAEDEYSVGLFKTTEQIFELKILGLKDQYELDYPGLKEDLNIPIDSEFSFSFLDTNRDVIFDTNQEEPEVSVYVEETPIQYLDSGANLNSGFINIKVW